MCKIEKSRKPSRAVAVAAFLAVLLPCSCVVYAWEVQYDASSGVLPTGASPSWQPDYYGAPVSLTNGVLYIGDSASGGAGFYRERGAIAAGVPVTVEARVRTAASSGGAAELLIRTYGREAVVGIFPDHIVASGRYSQAHTFWQDFTSFRTIRIAYDGAATAFVWVDNLLALTYEAPFHSALSGTPGGVSFGCYSSDSYWQYVAYSHSFEPVPEPSSLLALLAGVVGFAATLRRRRRYGGDRT